MAAPPLVFEFLGVVFAAILYGIYCVIFCLYWRIQLKRADRRKGVLLYAVTANFILCTVFFIISIVNVQFFITMNVLNEISLIFAMEQMTIAIVALYIAIDFISQLILLYRCWILWRRPLVMVIPCILSLAFIVTALTNFGFQIKSKVDDQPVFLYWDFSSAFTAFFFISLAVNALVTALIVYRIITVYNDIQGLNSNVQASAHGNGRRNLYPLISILIESGLITFVAQLAQPIMYKSITEAFPLVNGSVVMLYGISTTVVLVRVEMGISSPNDQNTSRTMNSSNHSGPPLIQFWKLNS